MRPEWRETAERPDDTPLSEEGHQQALETGEFLRDRGGVEVVYTSPFLRAVETAAGVADVLDVPIRIEEGLCEVMNPDWFAARPDFLPAEELAQQFPRIDLDYVSQVHPTFPEIESNGDVGNRCLLTVNALLQGGWSRSLWVGHGASVGGIGWALNGHVEDVCFKLCGLTGWEGEPGAWRTLYSGVDHLSFTEDAVKFH